MRFCIVGIESATEIKAIAQLSRKTFAICAIVKIKIAENYKTSLLCNLCLQYIDIIIESDNSFNLRRMLLTHFSAIDEDQLKSGNCCGMSIGSIQPLHIASYTNLAITTILSYIRKVGGHVILH